MDRLFLYLGICIWIWAGNHSATWHVSGYIPIRCVSRQEAGNIMMVPVISVACRQFKTKNTIFPSGGRSTAAAPAIRRFLCPCMQMCSLSQSLRLQFADLFHDLPLAHKITVNQTGAFYFSQACCEMYPFFSRNKLMTTFVKSQSLWMFSVWLGSPAT